MRDRRHAILTHFLPTVVSVSPSSRHRVSLSFSLQGKRVCLFSDVTEIQSSKTNEILEEEQKEEEIEKVVESFSDRGFHFLGESFGHESDFETRSLETCRTVPTLQKSNVAEIFEKRFD